MRNYNIYDMKKNHCLIQIRKANRNVDGKKPLNIEKQTARR